MWILLTIFLSGSQFYTLKWLLLATDIVLIILFLVATIGRIIFAAAANDKFALYYMVLVTSMTIWNYISYFWGETSVYWGNSEFIREPLDLTIIFWLIINAATALYAYKFDFIPAFSDKNQNTEIRMNIKERADKICEQYKITPREREFIELIYSGKSNKEIADTLFLSESTVKTHIYNIFRKMDIKSRVGIICILNGEDGRNEEDETE
ncbi:MAG: helix-turn-helix transcriptional regulator [Clostridiales bacterium]|nr:helix-turn-helix transcriptional regulator [Clostridiales bacterium]